MMEQWSPSGNPPFENLDRLTSKQRIYQKGKVLGENWKFKKEEL